MYVPQRVICDAEAQSGLSVLVAIRALEGKHASQYSGLNLVCEGRCGPLGNQHGGGMAKPDGPKVSKPVRTARTPNRDGSLQLAAGSEGPPQDWLTFELPKKFWGGDLHCRLKLWEPRTMRHRLLGEVCFRLPCRFDSSDSRPMPLEGGGQGLAIRVDARWIGLRRLALIRVADALGAHAYSAALKHDWQKTWQCAQLALYGGWELPSCDPQETTIAEQCRALVVGKQDKDGRTALRLCISPAGGPAVQAAEVLLAARADPHIVSSEGESPLTAALRAGEPFASLLLPRALERNSALEGLQAQEPWWPGGRINWDALRSTRAFALILFAAEKLGGDSDPSRTPSRTPSSNAKTSALMHTLCHAVLRRYPDMSLRVLAVLPPFRGTASGAETGLLQQMLQLAREDDRWYPAVEAFLQRGSLMGVGAWRGGQKVLNSLADLASKHNPRARQLLLETVLGPEGERYADEPRALFAERAAECAVCFEPLYENQPAYFLNEKGVRACVHYVCSNCAKDCVSSKECPMCRASVSKWRSLPSLDDDPRGWFEVASCGDGNLDPTELCHAIAASLPVSEELLMEAIEDDEGPMKQCWDKKGHGAITLEEFFDPQGGLFVWILAHLQELRRAVRRSGGAAPDVRVDPSGWFDYWDDRGTGNLSFGDVLRGVYGARKLEGLEGRRQLQAVRAEVSELWRASGIDEESVTKAGFLRPQGLAEKLAASFDRTSVPKGEVQIAALEFQRPPPRAPSVADVGATLLSSSLSPEGITATEDPAEVLVAMGFARPRAEAALRAARGNLEYAAALLMGDGRGGSGRREEPRGGGPPRRADNRNFGAARYSNRR